MLNEREGEHQGLKAISRDLGVEPKIEPGVCRVSAGARESYLGWF